MVISFFARVRIAAVVGILFAGGMAACGRAAPEVTPSAAPLLAVVTWNLNAGRGDLPRLIDDLAAGRVTDPAAREYVLLLQEAMQGGDGDVLAVGAARALATHFVAVRPLAQRTSGNAILSTRPLDDRRAIDLPRERQPRGAAMASIEIAGERLFVVSTHLENRLAWLHGLFGDRARGRQVDALLAQVPLQGPGILGGDMNTMLGPGEPAWRALLARFPDTPARPEPTFRDRLVLDHVFLDLPDRWTATRRVLREQYGSDHHPVVAQIRAP